LFLLILESLGSGELLFILVMALVFFGPRKLPQISRSLGKHVNDFRRASEDFKRTWDKEVSIEELSAPTGSGAALTENSILNSEQDGELGPVQGPTIQTVGPDQAIARQSNFSDVNSEGPEAHATDTSALAFDGVDAETAADEIDASSKREWL
jgi:Tat protein translocase TatB subunit